MKDFFLFETELGGGKELTAAAVFSLIWHDRARAMYYLTVLGLDKLLIGYFKLAYANPRPYMINS